MSAKILKGTVVSTKMKNTCVVRVDVAKTHPRYRKNYIAHKKYSAECGNKEVHEGNVVMIREIAPISKTKQWLVVEVFA